DDVVACGSRAKRIVPGADTANRPARHPNPRPVNFAQVSALFLRQGPRAILVELDVSAGGNSQVEVKLSMEILQVAMAIDEARENRLASDVNKLCMGRNRDFATMTNCENPACLDNDDGIFDGRPASAIDQFSTLHHEYFLCHVSFPSCFRSPNCRESRSR